MLGSPLAFCHYNGLAVRLERVLPLPKVFLLNSEVVVGNRNDRGFLARLTPSVESALAREALFEQVKRTLRMLKCRLVAAELREGGT